MLHVTEFPDILYNDFHVAYKYFTRQKIAKMPWIAELEKLCINRKMRACAKNSEINL